MPDRKVVPLRSIRACAICGKKAVPEFHPFCSKHCADVDLNRWLKGSYAIPGAEVQDGSNEGQDGQDGEGPDQA